LTLLVTWQESHPACKELCGGGTGVVICLEQGADLHMAHLMPLPVTVSCTTHTHTRPFNGPMSGTTRVSRYQKGKTNLDFTEARDSEWQWHLLGYMQPCSSQITMPVPHHSIFYRPDALPAAHNSVKALSLAQASVKSRLVSPFWYLFTQVVPE